MFKSMLEKIAKKQFTQKFKKSWYEGYQSQSWKHLLEHNHFTSELASYDWILSTFDRAGKTEADIQLQIEDMAHKIFNIFVERSSQLFSDDDTLMWLREVIGFTLNKMDSGDIIEPELLIGQLQSGIVSVNFSWKRYIELKKTDFSDDQQIVAAQELLGQAPDVNNQIGLDQIPMGQN